MPDRPGDTEYNSQVPPGSADFDEGSNDDPESEHAEPTEGGALRKKLEESIARVKELEAEKDAEVGDLSGQLMDAAYNALGLDTGKGIGKAASLIYDGEPAGLADFVAEEFDYYGPDNPMTRVINDGHARLDQAGMTAGSVPVTPTQDDVLAQAEARGDYATTMRIKSNQIADQFQRGAGR